MAIENIEGVILAPVSLRGTSGRDTSGRLVVDTGSGFLSLDQSLARNLGVCDSTATLQGLQLAPNALARLELGTMQLDQVAPVLVIDSEIIRRVTGQDVLGLAGQSVFAGHAVWIDYTGERMICVPSPPESLRQDSSGVAMPNERVEIAAAGNAALADLNALRLARSKRSHRLLAPLLSSAARPIPFRLAGDHKMLVRARFRDARNGDAGDWLTLVFDTGATKSCLFESALNEYHPAARGWKSMGGLIAPTLVGSPATRLVIAPVMELESIGPHHPLRRARVDCAVLTTELATALSAAVGEPVIGLLGYSFFKRYRVAVDYPNLTLWLDPDRNARDDRPFEYSHVGIQLECDGDRVRVVGIASASPAERAGIAVGDTLVSIGARKAHADELLRLAESLEGAPGTFVWLTLRRDGVQRTYRLLRRRLL